MKFTQQHLQSPDYLLRMFAADCKEPLQDKLLSEGAYNALVAAASGSGADARYAGVQRDIQDLTAAYLLLAECMDRFTDAMDRVRNLEISMDVLERIQKMLPNYPSSTV